MTSSTTAMHDDPLSFFAAEHEKDVAQIVKGGNSSAFADGAFSLFSEMWTETISPLGKEMKSAAVSAATSAADYLMQQSQSTPTDSNVENGPFRGSIAQQKEEDVSIGDANTCEEIALLTGEKILMSLKDAYIQISPGRLLPGILFMTNYRIAFVPSPAHLASIAVVNPSVYSWLNVPLASIDRVEKERKIKEARNYNITIVITCKDVRQHRISTNGGEYEIDRAFSTLSAYAFPNKMQHLFAFSHTLSPAEAVPAFERYEAIQEYSRQGIMDVQAAVGAGSPQDSMWRISTANKDYNLCRTYPQYMVMPRGMTDDELFLVSNFRSGHRLPTLSWGDKENGATMWRSSQPKAGVSGSCSHDEKFLELIAQSCVIKRDPLGNRKIVGDPILHVVDCRPRASAMANRATGAGYESQTSYPYVRLEFYNIGNIHVMRDSLKGLMSLVLSPSPPSGDMHFSRLVEDTQWLMHIRLIIKASWDTAAFIRRGQPVLVHCSHGWDRTAQVCSLAQLFLDPFYRTIDGFKVLVEKEWCSFGHPFELRCAHAQPRSSRQEDQMAPVFLQFLDCVWQLVRQYPHYFEFNCRYLVTLADHVYSCRFSTFLFSCDFDRVSLRSLFHPIFIVLA